MVKVGDRVRVEGESRYLFGLTGEVLGFGVGAAIVQLEEATGRGLPEGFPPGRPVMVKTGSLVVIGY